MSISEFADSNKQFPRDVISGEVIEGCKPMSVSECNALHDFHVQLFLAQY
jgi:hypothetical protein